MLGGPEKVLEKRAGRRPGQPNYTPEQKEAAVLLYREKGQAEAHRLTGIPVSSLARWAKEAGVRAPVTPQSANLPSVRAAVADIEEKVEAAQREVEAFEGTEVVTDEEMEQGWSRVWRLSNLAEEAALTVGDTMGAQRLNNVMGTATDKLRLIRGQATSRREELTSPDEATGRLLSMFDAIRARQAGTLLDAHSRAGDRVPGDHVPELPNLRALDVSSSPADAPVPGHEDRAPWEDD